MMRNQWALVDVPLGNCVLPNCYTQGGGRWPIAKASSWGIVLGYRLGVSSRLAPLALPRAVTEHPARPIRKRQSIRSGDSDVGSVGPGCVPALVPIGAATD